MNFVFLVRSFVANLVFLAIFLSKYAVHFPEKFHFRFFNWGEIFFNECTGIAFLLLSTEPVVYQAFGWKMGHILGVSLQKHGVFLKIWCFWSFSWANMPVTYLKFFIFDSFIEGRNFLANVRGSRFDFPLQNLSFIKYLDGKWGTFWAFRYKSMAYF